MANSVASPNTNVYCLLTSPKNTHSNLTPTSSPFWGACWCCVTFLFLFSFVVIHHGLTCTPSALSLFLSFKGTLHVLVILWASCYSGCSIWWAVPHCCIFQCRCQCVHIKMTNLICVHRILIVPAFCSSPNRHGICSRQTFDSGQLNNSHYVMTRDFISVWDTTGTASKRRSPFGSFGKRQFLSVCPCPFLVTLQSHIISSSVILML